jgi:hypothetical protein
MPASPIRQLNSDRTWADLRPIVVSRPAAVVAASLVLVEAATWRRDRVGILHLMAASPALMPSMNGVRPALNCCYRPRKIALRQVSVKRVF